MHKILLALAGLTGLLLGIASPVATALEVNLTSSMPYLEVLHEGRKVRIQRIQDTAHVITGGFARTSRKCPPFCIQPMQVAPGVTTVGELEVFNFMELMVNTGEGLLIDARLPDWYRKGTIPGSVNIPFTLFNLPDDDPRFVAVMQRLGVRPASADGGGLMQKVKAMFGDAPQGNGRWDFSMAKDILLWCNGMWCGQSPRAIRGLLGHGYPPEKIRYYRGGMQSWRILGLTVVVPKTVGK